MRFNHVFAALRFCTVAVAVTATASTSFAAQEFEDFIPIELAKALLGQSSQIAIYREIPDTFPPFSMPVGAQVLGVVDRGMVQQVILRPGAPVQEDVQWLSEDLLSRGYVLTNTMPAPPPQGQWVFATPPTTPPQLCHDSYGIITIQTIENSAGPLITLHTSHLSNRPDFSCASILDPRSPNSPAALSIDRYLPLLSPPAGASVSRGMSVALRRVEATAETTLDMTLDWSLSRVTEFVQEQLLDQAWARDNNTAGMLSALSGWTTNTEMGIIYGVLQIVQTGEEKFRVEFGIQLLDEAEP